MAQSGSGDPYWYEWYVGLSYIVDMLYKPNTIESVTFQKDNFGSIDDVVVKRKESNTLLCCQVKHEKITTQTKTSITFNSLITPTKEKKDSLINGLADGWMEVGAHEGASPDVILFTNKSFGNRKSPLVFKGKQYQALPLCQFLASIKEAIDSAGSEGELVFADDDLSTQWGAFSDAIGFADSKDIIRFVLSFTIVADSPGYLEKRQEILNDIAKKLCGGNQSLAEPIFNTLKARLDVWTSSQPGLNVVDRDEAIRCIAELNRKPFQPPINVGIPSPVFPSRISACENIEEELRSKGHKVVFLRGAPGIGKSRLVSLLCENMTPAPIRFYTFRPLDEEGYSISQDEGQCSPENLWSCLLNQIREQFPEWTQNHSIPFLDELCTVHELQSETLRLAKELAEKNGHPTILIIDGIDHAARSNRDLTFLEALPSPESIPEGVKLVLSGQNENQHPRYPSWLRRENNNVEVIDIPPLDENDISLLLDATTSFSSSDRTILSKNIFRLTKGNTLSVVYSKELIRNCTNQQDAIDLINTSGISDDVEAYYDQIWRNLSLQIKEELLPEPDTDNIVAALFHLFDGAIETSIAVNALPATFIRPYLAEKVFHILDPLARLHRDGCCRIIHNDFRLYISRIATQVSNEGCLKYVASSLADYLAPQSKSMTKSYYLIRMLIVGDRRFELINTFDTSFVMEAISLGVPWDIMCAQAKMVYKIACQSGAIESLHKVYLALCTLNQHYSHRDYYLETPPVAESVDLLPFDLHVVPLSRRNLSRYREVLERVNWLRQQPEPHAKENAEVIFDAWFSFYSPIDAVSIVSGSSEGYFDQGEELDELMKAWGLYSAHIHTPLKTIAKVAEKESGHRKPLTVFIESYAESALAIDEDRFKSAREEGFLTWDCVKRVLNNHMQKIAEYNEESFQRLCRNLISRYPNTPTGRQAALLYAVSGFSDDVLQVDFEGLLDKQENHYFDDEKTMDLLTQCFLFGIQNQDKPLSSLSVEMRLRLEWVDKESRESPYLLVCVEIAAVLGRLLGSSSLTATENAYVERIISKYLTTKFPPFFSAFNAHVCILYVLLSQNGAAIWGSKITTENLKNTKFTSYRIIYSYLIGIEEMQVVGELLTMVYGEGCQRLLEYDNPRQIHDKLKEYGQIVCPELMEIAEKAIQSNASAFTDHKDYSLSSVNDLFVCAIASDDTPIELDALRMLRIDKMASANGGNRLSDDIYAAVYRWAVSGEPERLQRIRHISDEARFDYAELASQADILLSNAVNLDDIIACACLSIGFCSTFMKGEVFQLVNFFRQCRTRANELGCDTEFEAFVSQFTINIDSEISSEYEQSSYVIEKEKVLEDFTNEIKGYSSDDVARFLANNDRDSNKWDKILILWDEHLNLTLYDEEIVGMITSACGTQLCDWDWSHYSDGLSNLTERMLLSMNDSSFFMFMEQLEGSLEKYGFQTSMRNILFALKTKVQRDQSHIALALFRAECASKELWATANNSISLPDIYRDFDIPTPATNQVEIVMSILVDQLIVTDPHRRHMAMRGIRYLVETIPGSIAYIESMWDNLSVDQTESIAYLYPLWKKEKNEFPGLRKKIEEEYASMNVLGKRLMFGEILGIPYPNHSASVYDYDLPSLILPTQKPAPTLYESFLREMERNLDDNCEDIRYAISQSSEVDIPTVPRNCMRRGDCSLPVTGKDRMSDAILYGEDSQGRWNDCPYREKASRLATPEDPWVLATMPTVLERTAWNLDDIESALESSDKKKAIDLLIQVTEGGIDQNEAILGSRIFIPCGEAELANLYISLRLTHETNLASKDHSGGMLGCYGLLSNSGSYVEAGFSLTPLDISLCPKIGGLISIIFGDCQIAPTNFLRELGLYPLKESPFIWADSLGNVVIRFEHVIVPCRDNYHEPYYRQPQLWRWIVKMDSFQEILDHHNCRVYPITEFEYDTDPLV